jgi:hypothetical protein
MQAGLPSGCLAVDRAVDRAFFALKIWVSLHTWSRLSSTDTRCYLVILRSTWHLYPQRYTRLNNAQPRAHASMDCDEVATSSSYRSLCFFMLGTFSSFSSTDINCVMFMSDINCLATCRRWESATSQWRTDARPLIFESCVFSASSTPVPVIINLVLFYNPPGFLRQIIRKWRHGR